jgi:hypothetical protein
MSSHVKMFTSKYVCLGHPAITEENVPGSSVQAKAVVEVWQRSTLQANIFYADIVTIWLIQVRGKPKRSGCWIRLKKYADDLVPTIVKISLSHLNLKACIGEHMRSSLMKHKRSS